MRAGVLLVIVSWLSWFLAAAHAYPSSPFDYDFFDNQFSGSSGGQRVAPLHSYEADPQKILNSSFRIAAREGRLGAIRELLRQGAELNSASDEGWTALMYASRNCSEHIVSFLVGLKADVNKKDRYGRTALMYAAMGTCVPVVRVLLRVSDVNTTVRDQFGGSAVEYAEPAFEIVDLIKAQTARARARARRG